MAKERGCAGFLFRLVFALVLVGAAALVFVWDDYIQVRRAFSRARQEDLPAVTVGAVVAAEDPDFNQRSSFYTFQRIADFVTGKSSRRPPSLTQLMIGSYVHGKYLVRVAKEAILCATIDLSYPKDAIADAYASNVYLGSVDGKPVNGMADGARAYFGVGPEKLTPEQAASLAAAIRSPSLFSPSATSARAKARRAEILQGMKKAGVIAASHK